ncbi:hypothetical protein PoB_000651600 [Plakobranchus ocellatus]|uniref:Uncharacterized protein n=1 Tax=Plakobranchus ocellatus TaxID=259542 RepID=A0AAV3Y9V8_9GAST|nr:hypothetical protein PoB_000651600 [Plakobranchus ocellatus]
MGNTCKEKSCPWDAICLFKKGISPPTRQNLKYGSSFDISRIYSIILDAMKTAGKEIENSGATSSTQTHDSTLNKDTFMTRVQVYILARPDQDGQNLNSRGRREGMEEEGKGRVIKWLQANPPQNL